jgi:hypothetical protein
VRSAPRGGRERGPGVRSPSGACGVSARWVLHIVRGGCVVLCVVGVVFVWFVWCGNVWGICVWRGMYGVFFVGPSGVLFCEFSVSVRWFL